MTPPRPLAALRIDLLTGASLDIASRRWLATLVLKVIRPEIQQRDDARGIAGTQGNL